MFTVYCVMAAGACLTVGKAYEVQLYWKEHPTSKTEALGIIDDAGVSRALSARRFSGQPPAKEVPAKRSTDPATCKKPVRLNEMEEKVLAAMLNVKRYHPNLGCTGKEIALWTLLPLNTVTPRFAPLVRKGKIKDSGERRDRQIVWVLNES